MCPRKQACAPGAPPPPDHTEPAARCSKRRGLPHPQGPLGPGRRHARTTCIPPKPDTMCRPENGESNDLADSRPLGGTVDQKSIPVPGAVHELSAAHPENLGAAAAYAAGRPQLGGRLQGDAHAKPRPSGADTMPADLRGKPNESRKERDRNSPTHQGLPSEGHGQRRSLETSRRSQKRPSPAAEIPDHGPTRSPPRAIPTLT